MMKRWAIHTILSEAEMTDIAAFIGQEEKKTDGEIRVALREKRHWGEKKNPLDRLALKEFHRLGMHRTARRTGILIFILISERSFHIVADEGIHRKVEEGTWETVAEALGRSFREGKFYEGIREAIAAVANILSKHFPARPDDTNELPNSVSIS